MESGGPPAVFCRRPWLSLRTCYQPTLRVRVQAPVEVRVVCLILRNVEDGGRSILYTINCGPDRKHGVDRPSVLAHQPAEIPFPVPGQIHPECALVEEQALRAVRGRRYDHERGESGERGPERVQVRKVRPTRSAGPKVVLGLNQTRLDPRRERNRGGLRGVDLLLDERSHTAD